MVVGSGQQSKSLWPGGHCFNIDWVSKKFSTVTRSSFAAELRNQLEAAQAAVYFATFMEENIGPISAIELAHKQDQGRTTMSTMLIGDNKGVFQACTAQNPKTPAEPVLTPHCRAVREMLDKWMLSKILWCDNRDMIADPSQKGKPEGRAQ